ncbi:hypothetical protein C3L33_04464, partial [Rhododendron williamsianum]
MGFDGVEGVNGEVLDGAGNGTGEHVLVEVVAVVGGGDGVHGEVGAVGFGELNWVVVIQNMESSTPSLHQGDLHQDILAYPRGDRLSLIGPNRRIVKGVLAGIPFLTYPIIGDQMPNSKTIVEDWKIGWKVRRGMGDEEHLVTREEIVSIVRRFMDLESDEVNEMRRKVKELEEICGRAISEGGSAESAIDSFIQDISCHDVTLVWQISPSSPEAQPSWGAVES